MKESKNTIDDLARMVKIGFDGVTTEISGVKEEVKKLKEQNEKDHEDIKLRLDNVAYRFEFVELQRRVTLLEKKAGFAK